MNVPFIASEKLVKTRGFIRSFQANGYLLDEPMLIQQKHDAEIRNHYAISLYQPVKISNGLQQYDRYTIYLYKEELVLDIQKIDKVSLIQVEGHFTYSRTQRAIILIADSLVLVNKSENDLRTQEQLRDALKQYKAQKEVIKLTDEE